MRAILVSIVCNSTVKFTLASSSCSAPKATWIRSSSCHDSKAGVP